MIDAANALSRPVRVYRLVKETVGWTFWEDGRRLFSLEDDADALIIANSIVSGVNAMGNPSKLEISAGAAVIAFPRPLQDEGRVIPPAA